MDDATRDKLKFQLSVLQERLAELKERKAEADGKPKVSKLDQSLERIRINDPREYVRIMESRDVAEKKLAPKPIGAMDKKDIVLLADLLKGVTAESYGDRLGDIERVNPDLLRALKPEYNEPSIQTILNLANKEKQQNATDEIKSLTYSIGALGEGPAELSTKVKLKGRLQELLESKYEDREVATEGTEPAKDALQGAIDSIKWTSKPEVDKAKSSLLSRIDTDVSASKLSTSDAGELKTNLENKVSQIVPRGVPKETKDQFHAWRMGQADNLVTVAAGFALADQLGPVIKAAQERGDDLLNVNDSQKLAAIYYRTYAPGVLTGGEMGSAVNSLKNPDSDAFTQGLLNLRDQYRFVDNRIKLSDGINVYNKGLETGSSAYKRVMTSLATPSGTDKSLSKLFIQGFAVDPASYRVNPVKKDGEKITASTRLTRR